MVTKKIILIDSENREIKEVVINRSECLSKSYELIGNGCYTVAIGIHLAQGDAIMGDDEGYFTPDLCGFRYESMFIYGNAVIWGMDKEGDLDDVKTPISEIKANVRWVDRSESNKIREIINNTPPTILTWDI